MGLNIGAVTRDIAGFRARQPFEAPDPNRTARQSARNDERAPQITSSRIQLEPPIGTLFNREQEEPIRAGFGENTISPPGAAIRTLDEGVRSARATLPTLEEQRETIRERLGELREAQQREPIERPQSPERLDLTGPRAEAAERTRESVNQIDTASDVNQVRLEGEQPERRVPPATVSINRQVFEFPRENTPQFIDVLA